MSILDLNTEQLEYLHKTLDRSDIWVKVHNALCTADQKKAEKEHIASLYKGWEESKRVSNPGISHPKHVVAEIKQEHEGPWPPTGRMYFGKVPVEHVDVFKYADDTTPDSGNGRRRWPISTWE